MTVSCPGPQQQQKTTTTTTTSTKCCCLNCNRTIFKNNCSVVCSFSISSWVFVSSIMMINVEGNDKSRKVNCKYTVHVYTIVHTYMDTHIHTLKQKGEMAKQPQYHPSKKIIEDSIQSTETEAEDGQGGR